MRRLLAMWTAYQERRRARVAQQRDVDAALVQERARTQRLVQALDDEMSELSGAEARMMRYLAGARLEASRSRAGHRGE